jgi:hypothetical protein
MVITLQGEAEIDRVLPALAKNGFVFTVLSSNSLESVVGLKLEGDIVVAEQRAALARKVVNGG